MRQPERLHARRSVRLLALLFALSLVAAACGDDDDTTSSDSTAEGSGATSEPAAGGARGHWQVSMNFGANATFCLVVWTSEQNKQQCRLLVR